MGAAAEAPPGAGQGGGPAMAEIQQLRDIVEKNPNDIQAVRKLADLNFDIQNWQRAQELYSHYLELKPNDPDVITDLGITYRGLQQYDKAIDLFNQAKKLEPGHWQAYYNEVVVLAFDLKKTDAGQPGPGAAPAVAAGQSRRGEAGGGPGQAAQPDPVFMTRFLRDQDHRHHPPAGHPPDGREELQRPAQGGGLRSPLPPQGAAAPPRRRHRDPGPLRRLRHVHRGQPGVQEGG